MDVIDERIFLEEVARRLSDFVRDFPEEADRLFAEPMTFGNEVETMFTTLLGENPDMPFGVLLVSMLAGPQANCAHHLAMSYDDQGRLTGFTVVEIPKGTPKVVNDVRNRMGLAVLKDSEGAN